MIPPTTQPPFRWAWRMPTLLAATLVWASSLCAQTPPETGEVFTTAVRFRHLTVEDGLSQQHVNTIFQDSLGFMWFGTEDGLNRFDGQQVVVFRSVAFDTTSLRHSWVVEVLGAGGAGLWVVTASGGLNRFDARTQTFTNAPVRGPQPLGTDLYSMIESRDGTLWIGTRYDGLYRYAPHTGRVERIQLVPDEQQAPVRVRIDALVEDREGRLWVATNGRGLSRYDPAQAAWTHYRSQVPGRVSSLSRDAAGHIWIGTRGNGLYRYRSATDDFARYRHAADAPCSLGSDGVNTLLHEPDGTLWVGLDNGLSRMNLATGCFTTYRHDAKDPMSLPPGGVLSLYLDRTGIFWVGTTEGVGFFERQPSPFAYLGARANDPQTLTDPDVWSILEDRTGTLWVGTSGALHRIDPGTDRVTAYPIGSGPSALHGSVMSLYEDRRGQLWVGSYHGGLQRFDRTTGQVVERFAMRPDGLPDEEAVTSWGMLEDRKGRFWSTAVTGGCLNRLDRDTGTVTYYCHDPTNPHTPAHNDAHDLVESKQGGFWLGTWGGGLDWFDPDAGVFRHYRHDPANVNTPASDLVLAVREDAQGHVWLGLYDGGVDHFDPAAGTFVHYNTANSDLPSNMITALEIDARGDVWVSTLRGLARLTPSTGRIRTYGAEDGVQGRQFNNNASFRSPSGALYFGGDDGLTAFFPDRVEDATFLPPVVLTGLSIRGHPVGIGAESVLQQAMPFTDAITLRHDQRDIALSFVVPHYRDPRHTRFRYYLEGYDEAWYEGGADPTAVYTNLGPGQYVFHVQAASSAGTWHDAGTRLAIRVLPPPWRTWWAYGLYTLAFGGLLFGLLRYELGRLRLKDRLHLERLAGEKLRELDHAKSRFFANVSHEFRTPLTLTLGPLDDLLGGLHGTLAAPVMDQLRLARRSARRLLGLINEILDVAQLEAGRLVLQQQIHDLADFVRQTEAAYAALAERQGLNLHLHVPNAPILVYIDAQQLEKAVGNLISNALKFTPRGGTVTIRLSSSEGDGQGADVHLDVTDTGPGIPPDELGRVFDRFHQVNETTTTLQPGTGIGLALARELVELHGGTLTVSSTVGVGTTFTMTLPLHDADPERVVRGSDGLMGRIEARVERLTENFLPAPASAAEAPEEGEDLTTVLVVEDNPEVRAYLAGHLASHYRVLEAADGQDGLDVARASLPDLVIADVMMPRLDGVALCHALKNDPATDFIPVLLLTARAETQDKVDALREQADDYVTKPFDVREVLARVDNLIATRRQWRARMAQMPEMPPPGVRPTGDDLFAEHVYSVIDLHAPDPDFGVAELATYLEMDRKQLYRRLHHLERSPAEMIWEVRLEQAAHLLSERLGTIGEIAYGTGFKSISHFSKRFRERYGVTPSAYAVGGTRMNEA